MTTGIWVLSGLLLQVLTNHPDLQNRPEVPADRPVSQAPYDIDPCAPLDEGKETFPCGRAHLPLVDSAPGDPRDGGEPREALSDTDVLHYLLEIEILPEYSGLTPTAVAVHGVTTMTVRSTINGLTTFTVDLYNILTADSVTGNVGGWSRTGDVVTITLDRAYDADEVFMVAVEFHGYPETGGFGAFQWWTRNDVLVVGTLSEPYYARTWWACKDQLGDKATMEMHCTVPNPFKVASNGINEGTEALSGNRTLYKWHEINPMTAYLASLAIADYDVYNISYNYDAGNGPQSMPVPCYLYSDHWDSGAGQPFAIYKAGCDEIPTMLDRFGQRYGLYPFLNEKYGVAETGGPGGLTSNMEHQTISSMYRVDNYSDIMAHELAHHWWGDNVTCSTWFDIWINEGFASYSEAIYREIKPAGGIASYWSRMNARKPSNPNARVYRTSIDSVGAIFSTNDVYNKGAWVLHMLRHVMGDAAFFNALTNYRASFQGGFASTGDFAASISATFGADLSWFTDEWIMSFGSPRYEYNYISTAINGQNYLKLHLTQTQNAQGYGLFKMPIDLRITTTNGVQTKRIWNDSFSQYFVVPVAGAVTGLEIDQDGGTDNRNWILWQSITEMGNAIAPPPKILSAQVLPFGNTPGETRVILTFSENIGSFDSADVALSGASTGAHLPMSVSYTAGQLQATIVFDALPNDAYTLTIPSAGILANGQTLDGEISASTWYDPDLFPSGDGVQGGDAVIGFNLLSGDANCDGSVTLSDVGPFVNVALGADADLCHLLRSDANNDSVVDGRDVQLFVDAILDVN